MPRCSEKLRQAVVGRVVSSESCERVVRGEELAAKNPMVSRFGMNQINVARLE